MITATIASDDQSVRGTFDASPYFANRPDLAAFVRYLEEDNFGGGIADEIAYAAEGNEAIVDQVLAHCSRLMDAAHRNGGEYPGFEVTVNSDELYAWLQHERPSIYQALHAIDKE